MGVMGDKVLKKIKWRHRRKRVFGATFSSEGIRPYGIQPRDFRVRDRVRTIGVAQQHK
jgi:hypothetical protein